MADISIYEAIARNLSDLELKGQPSGATATTVDSNSFIHSQAGQLQGHSMYVFEGEGAGQERTITKFLPGNNRIELQEAWTTVPTVGSNFLVFRHFEAGDYENSLNRAMGWAALRYLADKVATISIVGTQFEYNVPSGFEYIQSLRIVPSGGTDYSDYEEDDLANRVFEFQVNSWGIEPNPHGSYLIVFDPRKVSLDNFNGDSMRVIGQAKPDFTGTLIDTDLEEYIINAASMLLSSMRIDSKDSGWKTKFYMFRDSTRELEEYIFRHRRGKAVR